MKNKSISLVFLMLPLIGLLAGCSQIGKAVASFAGINQTKVVLVLPETKVELNGKQGTVYGYSECGSVSINTAIVGPLDKAHAFYNHYHCAVIKEADRQVILAVFLNPPTDLNHPDLGNPQLFDVVRDPSGTVIGLKRVSDHAVLRFQ